MLKKLKKDLTVAICVPTYKRSEYTEKCIAGLHKAQEYNGKIFQYSKDSLRDTIIQFFEDSKDFDIIAKIDNDCIVPKNWLNDIIDIFQETDVDILSPDVSPSHPAYRYGTDGQLYRPSKIVGGLWVMRRELISGMEFYRYSVKGITGAFNILKQIINEKDPKVGWADKVVVQDLGHWSGDHPEHIKSEEHREYSTEVGRKIAW